MPKPVKRGSTFHVRVRVPADLVERLRGTSLSVPIGTRKKTVTLRDHFETSLQTKDAVEAKARLIAVLAALQQHYEAVRTGPKPLDHKTSLAIAGEIRARWVEAFDNNPGPVDRWTRVQQLDKQAVHGGKSPLSVPDERIRAHALEERYGPVVDAFLTAEHRNVDAASRTKLLSHVADAMSNMAEINLMKARGDYSDTGQSSKYPPYRGASVERAEAKSKNSISELTFGEVIRRQVDERRGVPHVAETRVGTIEKFEKAVREFSTHRGSDLISTVTAREADAWKRKMLAEGKLAANTIGQRIQNVRTVISWARRQELGDLFPVSNPLALVEVPEAEPVPEGERAFKLSEAELVLKAARREEKADLRWISWVCAYSGARVNEIAQLSPSSFFQVSGIWFMRLTTMGGRKLKNRFSERTVPIHDDLIHEGFLSFAVSEAEESERRLFSKRAANNVSDWVRGPLGLDRPLLRPTHGWRHLFEDRATGSGMSDAAKLYITGRSSGGSADIYGKSEAMLPGLSKEMTNFPSYFKSAQPN
ncbi:DUF6538 domain-containing protein [uncultured Sulfitobacter sp.]|uniref:DUF6538 domain-containing protein n=1 Tax=uncultured Sulfitobacter sp. TaxID=191468 RepID=UPI0026162773|nr:DUF6538 domain-containing protein [uncultured Sulfitobacter sp.]